MTSRLLSFTFLDEVHPTNSWHFWHAVTEAGRHACMLLVLCSLLLHWRHLIIGQLCSLNKSPTPGTVTLTTLTSSHAVFNSALPERRNLRDGYITHLRVLVCQWVVCKVFPGTCIDVQLEFFAGWMVRPCNFAILEGPGLTASFACHVLFGTLCSVELVCSFAKLASDYHLRILICQSAVIISLVLLISARSLLYGI